MSIKIIILNFNAVFISLALSLEHSSNVLYKVLILRSNDVSY